MSTPHTRLVEALDDLVAAYELPGDHCEMQQAITRAKAILAEAVERDSPPQALETAEMWLRKLAVAEKE